MSKPYMTMDRFSPHADALRAHFDGRFANPHEVRPDRFVWDYWNLPGQYNLLRTPAYQYFPAALYEKFHRHLRQWGRENLGCFELTPPWLSYYIDGCEQRLHADIPHGPWAYVFSLTPWKSRAFRGGETMILKPSTLNYWQNFADFDGVEERHLLDEIPALFNRLLVFDPRFPHGVRQVSGVRDPREARLVVHGWFTDPQPYVQGPLPRSRTADFINNWFGEQSDFFQEHSHLHGTLSLRLDIAASGQVRQVKALTNTLLSLDPKADPRAFLKPFLRRCSQMRFQKAKTSSRITLPVLFRA